MENSNGANYTAELEYIVQLITALEYIVSVLESKVPTYHPFRHLVAALLDGTLIKCDGCEEILSNDDGDPIHGLREQIEELYEVMEMLELEVQYELEGDNGEEM